MKKSKFTPEQTARILKEFDQGKIEIMDYSIGNTRTFQAGPMPHLPLIHITQQWETLVLILEQGFRPSYCTEDITNDKELKSAAFPMISLSNMAIKDAVQWQKSYGTLGIALDKAWGQKNDFNPVLYLNRQSDLTNEIINIFNYIKAASPKELLDIVNGVDVGHKHLLIRSVLKVFAHSKNYDGKLIRNETLCDETYPFGLEREWRKIIKGEHIPYFLVGEDIAKKKDFNQKVSDIRIDFGIDHIVGVIVESDWEKKAVEEIIIKKYKLSEPQYLHQ